ncbi:MAG: HPr family phosphocarrier protein [Chloroflexi bacterium]|nr:HPr family phosphocarrier protein [Chloroflexota bacterium]
MIEIDLMIAHPAGLHARPAALFVRTAARYDARVTVANITRDPARAADGASILGLMTLGVAAGQTVRLRATGPEAADAVAALTALVTGGFQAEEDATPPRTGP